METTTLYSHDDVSVGTLMDIIELYAKDGELTLDIWSRDCDGATGSRKKTIPAKVGAFAEVVASEYEWAAGPWEILIK